MTAVAPATCATCGTEVSGRFCTGCGAPTTARACSRCEAALSPGARFCHRCGQPATPAGAPSLAALAAGSGRTPWFVAAGAIVVAVLAIIWKVWGGPAGPQAPDMANAGNAPPGVEAPFAGGGGAPPDISRMGPRERFDRLFNRIMAAAESGDTATVVRFTPMGLGAYAQLDEVDADARYHAAVLHAQVGEFGPALALADTILRQNPGHLFGYLLRGEVAQLAGDEVAFALAQKDFLAHYDAEMKANRREYLEHTPALEDFKTRAQRR